MRRAVPSEPSTKCWRNPNPLLRSTFEDTNKWQHPKTSNNSDDVIVLMWTWIYSLAILKWNSMLCWQCSSIRKLDLYIVHWPILWIPLIAFMKVCFFWGCYSWTQQSTAPSHIRIYHHVHGETHFGPFCSPMIFKKCMWMSRVWSM